MLQKVLLATLTRFPFLETIISLEIYFTLFATNFHKHVLS